MPEICSRLKEARENLGLSQQALAERCGVTARSQRNYESGERLPDAAYLAALAAAGVDVLYVLTGQRMGGAAATPPPAPAAPALSPRKAALLDNYDNTSEEGKKIIEAAAFAAAQPAAKRGKAA